MEEILYGLQRYNLTIAVLLCSDCTYAVVPPMKRIRNLNNIRWCFYPMLRYYVDRITNHFDLQLRLGMSIERVRKGDRFTPTFLLSFLSFLIHPP